MNKAPNASSPSAERSASSANETCVACQGADTTPFAEKDGYAFLRCRDCGYIFCHPRPSQEDLADFYGFKKDIGPVGAAHYPKASSRKRRAYLNAIRLWPHIWRKRVLDVGCGGGFIVNAMKTFGAREAVGLDIAERSIEYARAHFPKCAFHIGPIEDFLDGRLDTFDFVYSSEVIEHVVDVDAYMRFLDLVTAPGAEVFITTPDIACDQVPEDVTAWSVFTPPEHIQFFTQDSLAHLFARYNFTAIKRVPDPGGEGLKMLFRKNT